MASPQKIKVAACHTAPVYQDAAGTTQKALGLIYTAASQGANLIVFSEAFIPSFPLYQAIHAPVNHGTHFSAYVAASIYTDGPEIATIEGATCLRIYSAAARLQDVSGTAM